MDQLLDTAPCGFLIFGDDGIITAVNETLATLLGYPKQSLCGKNIEDLFTVSGRIFYQTHFYPLLILHNRADEIFMQLKDSNVVLPVLVNAERRELNGTFQIHCVMMPVHQRQKYESEILTAKRTAEDALLKNELLQRAQTDLEAHKAELDRKITSLEIVNHEHIELSSIISHDVQEPIRKIAMFADMVMLQEGHLTEDSKSKLQKIRSSCRKMRDLVYSLDQYVASGRHAIKETISLTPLIEQIVNNAKTRYDIQPIVSINTLPAIEGYKEQLEILFYNLADNAFKFRAEDRALNITVDGSVIQLNSYKNTREKYNYSDHIRITFCDNGIGFDNRYSDYVFKMFKRINADIPGLGFGLAMCKKVVDQHQGMLECQSRVGEGTCFIITLPLVQ